MVRTPLYDEVREVGLRKCTPDRQLRSQDTFEQQPFGEFACLVTQKLLDVTKRVAREKLEHETWLDAVPRLSGQTYEQMRVIVLEFLNTDIFNISGKNCVTFLHTSINSWDVDLSNFGMEIVLNQRLVPGRPGRFEFVERAIDELVEEEPGLTEFLQDSALSGDATQDEIEFLRRLRFKGKRARPLYYYRALQNLRDSIHFRTGGPQSFSGGHCPRTASEHFQSALARFLPLLAEVFSRFGHKPPFTP